MAESNADVNSAMEQENVAAGGSDSKFKLVEEETAPSRPSELLTIGDAAGDKWCGYLMDQEETSDATINCGGTVFKVHKCVFAAESVFLRELLMPKVEKSIDSNDLCIDMDATMFDVCVKFVYLGSVEVTADQMWSVVDAAIFLGLGNMQKACMQAISHHINTTEQNFFKLWYYATKIHSLEYIQSCFTKALQLFDKFKFDDDFLNLPGELVAQYLTNPDLIVSRSEKCLSAAVVWGSRDSTSRLQQVKSILHQLPLFAMDQYFLNHLLYCSNFLQDDPEVAALLRLEQISSPDREGADVLCFISVMNPKVALITKNMVDIKRQGRPYHGSVTTAVGTDDTKLHYASISVNLNLDSRELTSLPSTAHGIFASCMRHNELFFSGLGAAFNEVWKYCLSDKTWKRLSDLKYARVGHQMLANGRDLYVMGGQKGYEGVSAIEVLPCGEGDWSLVSHAANVQLACADNNGNIALVTHEGKTFNLVRYSIQEKKAMSNINVQATSVQCMAVVGDTGFIFKYDGYPYNTCSIMFPLTGENAYTKLWENDILPCNPVGVNVMAHGKYLVIYETDRAFVALTNDVKDIKNRAQWKELKSASPGCVALHTGVVKV